MFEFLKVIFEWYMLFFVFGLTVVGWAFAIYSFWQWQRGYRFRRIRRQMVAELERFGYLLVAHTVGRVTAVCSFGSFYSSFICWEKIFSKCPEIQWNSLVYAHVFTFADGVMMCTGNRDDLESIVVDLIYDLLGKKYSKSLITAGIDDLAKVIIKHDKRLFVPFVGDKWRPEWEAHRNTTIPTARQLLHKEIVGQYSFRP